ncbi:LysR family transcriptional regulator [Glaciecola punicea ACAM 611]|uniref:LysR family transcriptional regulator n=2 Tax=Glaciecola TaxID=89404 RepID=H5TDR2_9ALTE|nr:LysR family transcriptional regulator [Glaciecola punicea ACAM 611]
MHKSGENAGLFMKQLSLTVLRTLVTIVEVGSFYKAGELLGRSQPAISLQIKKLEEQINRKLFTKVGQSYQLNKDGKWLYSKAKQLLAINDDVFRELSRETLRGRMRLGIPSEFASALLPSIVGEFSQRYPDVSLDVTSALSKTLLSANQSAQFDLILALMQPDDPSLRRSGNSSNNSTEMPNENNNIEIVREDDLVWVGDPNRSLPNDSLSLVLAPDGCVYRSRVIAELKQQTQPWKITYTNPDFYGLMAAIKQGLGITALARSIVPDELEIIRDKRLPSLGRINICLINQDTQHPQVSQTLSSYIKARIAYDRINV